jgi:hypothetical protein
MSGFAATPLARAAGQDPSNEFRFTLSPYHPIKGNLTGSAELGYYLNPEQDYETYTVLWPGLTYTAAKWMQLTAALRTLYTDNEHTADKLELRPFAGVKLFLPNDLNWHLFSYTRYEFRDTQDLETDDWSSHHRIRSRFGAQFPLTSRANAWQPKTWYGLVDVEPYYRFDEGTIDPLVARGGMGYVLSDRMRLEFIYYARFTRPESGGGLAHTGNSFRLNLRIGLEEGLLQRLQNPNDDD